MFIISILGAFIILVTLGSVLGVDMSLKNMFDILINTAAEITKFLSKFLEDIS